MVAAVKYFSEKAKEYGISEDKLCIGGCSAGAYTSMIACILMGREGISNLIKMQFLLSPMLGTGLEDAPENTVMDWEKPYINCLPYDLIASDFPKQNSERDVLLYPSDISLEEARKLPKTVLFTSEFDWLRRDTHNMIVKLKQAKVYADHADYAGSAHVFYLFSMDPNFKLFFDDI
jgi:acetyl esterase/lipase